MKWDDLKILVEVRRLGSFSQAARELGINHSSVSRRMRDLEMRAGVHLFERLSNGLALTAAGEELYTAAARMAEEAETVEHHIFGKDTQLRGLIRFATVDATACNIMPCLQKFLAHYPKIELELILSEHLSNLSRREADVVLRATNNPPETYVGRCVAKHAFAIFATHELIARYDLDTPLEAYPWVGWENGFFDAWMEKHMPTAKVVCRANTALGMIEAVRAGIGIAHLACFGVDSDTEFVRLSPPDPSLDLGLWLLIHPELRHSARIRAFMQFITDELTTQRDLIEGRFVND